ncbi:uncharacterized protein LOC144874353 isoform X2 [Branchiostoma floridae x Branchiostoma japonicum]
MRLFGHVALFGIALPLLTIAKSLSDLPIQGFVGDLEVKKVAKRSPGCTNVYNNCVCNFYKLKDHCSSPVHEAWMRGNCEATCGFCADPEDHICDNIYPDQMCDLFANRGLHQKPQLQYFMACKCPKACGICDVGRPSAALPIPDDTFDQEECLRLHNEKRSHHGAADLTWCPKCADFAQQMVQTLQDSNSPLIHSSSESRRWQVGGRMVPHGENLMYYFPKVDCRISVESWYKEKDLYKPRQPLALNIESAGHFTQMVWKDTTSVGCAKTEKYLACIYEPAGNWKSVFLFERNVQM